MTARRLRSVAADLIYLDGRFQRDRALEIDGAGRIAAVAPARRARVRLAGTALLPGFVNAHSHAFQRAIRGRSGGPSSGRSDFWSWREAMYAAANALDADGLYETSLHAFREMAAAGYTAVGEFHYLHRDAAGRAGREAGRPANRVVRAALDAGLRVTLLLTWYERAGFEADGLGPEQRRFGFDGDLSAFLAHVERIAAEWAAEPRVSVGVAAHSVRAVRPESLRAIAGWNERARRPLHIHLSEQRAEVDGCLQAYGCRPVEHAARCGILGPRTTAVHGTHLSPGEVALLARAGARVCVCPTTEADLGDGCVAAVELLEAGVPLCLGSDSHARIDPFEEMRRLEGHERLRVGRRNVLAAGSGLGPRLLEAATRNGADALGIDAGALRPGAWADFVAIDLEHPVLDGWEVGALAEMIALAADPRVVRGVWVGGAPVWLRR